MQGGGSTGSFLNFKLINGNERSHQIHSSSWNVSRGGLHVTTMNKGEDIQKLQNSSFLSTKCCVLSSQWNLAGRSNSFHFVEIPYAFKINNADNFCIHSISKRFWSVSQQLTVIMLACLNTLSIFILFLFCVSYWWNISCHVTWK